MYGETGSDVQTSTDLRSLAWTISKLGYIYLLQILIQKTPRASHKLHQSAGKKNLPEVRRQEEIHTNTHAKVEPSKKQMRTLYKPTIAVTGKTCKQ
jgi:hypothetical protein